MKLSSLSLEAFHAVSKSLSFSRAAAEVHITQSALSQRILNLEEELQMKLFIREPSGVRLTESGLILLRFCQTQSALEEEALGQLSQLTDKTKTGLSGTLRLGGFSTVLRSLLMPRLGPLVENHPAVKLELFSEELSVLPGLLRRGLADYIVLDRILDDRDLESHALGFEENVLIEAKGGTKRPDTYLDHDSEDKTTVRFWELQGKKASPARFSRSYLDDIYGIIDGVALGWGRAVVPRHLVENHRGVRILPGYKPLKTPIVLHYYRQPYYSKLHDELIRILF
jgi:DNA-binding transcriptional LysR family regulator